MNSDAIFGYVYSRFLDGKHTARVELPLNQHAFNDLSDFIEETKCADVGFYSCSVYPEIYFRCEEDMFNTLQRFMNHQANIIVFQLHQLVNTPVDPF